jgi:diguanylate cyclase (GGDEF)-like protein
MQLQAPQRETEPGNSHLQPPRAEGSNSLPARRRISPLLLAGVTAYMAVYMVWLAFGPDRTLMSDIAFLPLSALAAVASWRAGQRSVPGARLGWRLIALAILSYGIGDAIWTFYEAIGELPFPSLADPFYIAFYPLFLAGILRFRWRGRRGLGNRAQAILDALTIGFGAGAVLWYLVLGPAAYADAGSLLGNLVAVAYPAGDLALIAALVRLSMGVADTRIRRSLALLAAGLLLYVVADVLYSSTLLSAVYSGGGWLDPLWMLATAAFVFAAASAPTLIRGARRTNGEGANLPTAIGVLPYLAVVAVFALLIDVQWGDPFFPNVSLTLTAAVVAALISLRQFLAQRNLSDVYHELSDAHAEVAALAITDPLTGLPNHRGMVDVIDLELERAERYGRECSLLFIDIDHFKALNDDVGHEAGDRALGEVGELMSGLMRTVDTVGRWGGEEFVAVLPETGPDAAIAIAGRLRSTVDKRAFDGSAGTHLTVSIGAATYPGDAEIRSELLDAADGAMYAAKHLGRNRVLSAGSPVVTASRNGDDASDPGERRSLVGVRK